MDKDYIFKKIEKSRQEVIDLTSQLIKKETVNPPGDEYLAANIVRDYFDKHGIEYEEFAKEEKRPNILGYIGRGKSPSILLAAHLDVVPAGDPDSWATPPFVPVVKDGKIYGRGSTDNKGQLAALMVVGKILKEMEDELPCEVIIGAVADEELGSTYGMVYLMDENKIEPDYAIIPDIGGENRAIDIAEKGLVNVRVTSYGKKAHSSLPHLGVNAIEKLAEFIKKLEPIVLTHTEHPYLGSPTKSVNIIHGGAAHNIVPDKCEVLINIRFVPGMNEESIKKDFEQVAERVEGGKFKFKFEDKLEATEVPVDNILVDNLRKTAKEFLDIEVKPIGLGGATVCKQLIEKGITAVGFSPGDEKLAHMSDEYIEIEQLIEFEKIIIPTILQLKE